MTNVITQKVNFDSDQNDVFSFPFETTTQSFTLDTIRTKRSHVRLRQNLVNFFGRPGRFFEYYDYKMQDADNQRITHNADMYIQDLSVVDIGLRHTK